uniref:Uncharacterized protein n=1 Tax=Chlamydomonas reinhardtii TaxID=3055 RepID=Q36726_CHLRE|nr:unknown [Chlamydomonas reinhardtii]
MLFGRQGAGGSVPRSGCGGPGAKAWRRRVAEVARCSPAPAMAESGLYRGRAETNEPGHPAVLVGPRSSFALIVAGLWVWCWSSIVVTVL